MMLRIFAIFEMTFKKVKEPAFFLLFVIAAAIGFFVSEMEAISLGQDSDILFGLISLEKGHVLLGGFMIIFFMTVIVATFAGATDIPKDIDSRMIMLVLGKPVRRVEYLVGKYFGIIAICFAFFATATLTATVVHLINSGNLYPLPVLFRQFFLLFGIFPFVAMTMMISTFLSDISAMIITVVYLMLSLFISALSIFIDMLPKSLDVVSLIHIVSFFVPNFFYFFNSFKFSGIVMFALIGYSLSLTVIFLSIATCQLNRRDMN